MIASSDTSKMGKNCVFPVELSSPIWALESTAAAKLEAAAKIEAAGTLGFCCSSNGASDTSWVRATQSRPFDFFQLHSSVKEEDGCITHIWPIWLVKGTTLECSCCVWSTEVNTRVCSCTASAC